MKVAELLLRSVLYDSIVFRDIQRPYLILFRIHYTSVQLLTQEACMSRHWFPSRNPCITVYAALGMLCCGTTSVYDSSEFYNMCYIDSYYILNAAIPYGFLCYNNTKFYALIL